MACSGSTPTWTAATWGDIQNCHDQAGFQQGDTILLTTGSKTGNSSVTLSKSCILQGAGVGNTVVTSTVSTGTKLIVVTLVANRTTRITGIEFNGTTVNTEALIQVSGCSNDDRRIRIDNCKFDQLRQTCFEMITALGVVDHNTLIGPVAGQQVYIAQVKGLAWGAGGCGGNTNGDEAWSEADNFGTDKFTFFENNTHTSLYTGSHLTLIDCHSGGRYVARYNSFEKGNLECHGQEAGRLRSTRAVEAYNNTFVGLNNGVAGNLVGFFRGGVQVIHDNAVWGYATGENLALLDDKTCDALGRPFFGGDGRNIWDVNHASNPFVTGSRTSSGTLTVTDNTKSWTTDEWRGYTVRKTSGKSVSSLTRSGSTYTVSCTGHGFSTNDRVTIFGASQIGYDGLWAITVTDANTFTFTNEMTPASPATGTILATLGNSFSVILANNTTGQLTFAASLFSGVIPNIDLNFGAGDTFEINKVITTLDAVGRSQGSAISGATPTLPAGWNDQVTTGSYEWNNVTCTSNPPVVGCVGGNNIDFGPSSSRGLNFVLNTDYFNDTAKPGYTTFTYPHPLTGESPAPPAAPATGRALLLVARLLVLAAVVAASYFFR